LCEAFSAVCKKIDLDLVRRALKCVRSGRCGFGQLRYDDLPFPVALYNHVRVNVANIPSRAFILDFVILGSMDDGYILRYETNAAAR
jgi:hypothetical protein